MGTQGIMDPATKARAVATAANANAAAAGQKATGSGSAFTQPGVQVPATQPGFSSPGSANSPFGGSAIAAPGVQAPGTGPGAGLPSTSNPFGAPVQANPVDPNMDMSTPGPGETAWNTYGSGFFGPNALSKWSSANPGAFGSPGQGEQYWNQVQGGLMAPTNSEQAFKGFQANKPTIAQDPGLAAYYDVAQKRAAEQINRGLAARGMYGSTAGLQQLGRSATDLSAEEANRNAQYNLQRLGEQRAWEGLGLQGANAADATRTARYGLGGQLAMGGEALGLSRLGEGAGIAGQEAGLDLSGRSAGMGAALGAQGARTQRIQSGFQGVSQPSQFMAGLEMGGYGSLLGSDQGNFDSGVAATLGMGANGVNTAAGNDAQTLAKFGLMVDAGGHIVSMGMAPGGIFNPKQAPATQPGFMSPQTSASGY